MALITIDNWQHVRNQAEEDMDGWEVEVRERERERERERYKCRRRHHYSYDNNTKRILSVTRTFFAKIRVRVDHGDGVDYATVLPTCSIHSVV